MFDGYVPELNPQELKDLLRPVFDFNAKSPVEAYLDTLTPKLRDAIKAHQILVGMNREMVMASKGRPPKKIREKDGEIEYEEWIYGEPPQDVDFVRLVGDEVVRLESMKVDGEKIVHTEKEVDLANHRGQEFRRRCVPPNAPSLRRPGEEVDTASPAGGRAPMTGPPPDPLGQDGPSLRPTKECGSSQPWEAASGCPQRQSSASSGATSRSLAQALFATSLADRCRAVRDRTAEGGCPHVICLPHLAPVHSSLYTGRVKIALGQINPTVGDFSGNAAKIIDFAQQARAAGAGLILFPELAVCGYPPRDLVERPSFVARNRETVERIAAETRGIAVICGLVTPAHAETGKSVMNSAALLKDGAIAFLQSKMLLPTYDVFDEMRNFAPAKSQSLFPFCGKQMALTICEDAWNDKHFWNKRLYTVDPVESLVQAGGNFVLNISASPFWMGKRELRREMLATIARQDKVPVAMVNQVGGNDSLVFDGSSLVLNPAGEVIAQGKSFEEDLDLLRFRSA